VFGAGGSNREVTVTRTPSRPDAATLLSQAAMHGEPPTALLATLDPDELRTALNDVLSVVGDFVHHIADYNLVSERAVLRSMGVEPGQWSDNVSPPEKSNIARLPSSSNTRAASQRF
jgi:hypothetical protein